MQKVFHGGIFTKLLDKVWLQCIRFSLSIKDIHVFGIQFVSIKYRNTRYLGLTIESGQFCGMIRVVPAVKLYLRFEKLIQ